MKPLITPLVAAATALLGHQANAAVVLSNNFDGNNANDIGPSFGLMSNGNEDNDTSNASTGRISFNDTDIGTPTVGFSSNSAIDLSSVAGFTLTWNIAGGAPANVGSMAANGWFFGVQSTQGQQGVGTTLYNNEPAAFGVVIRRTSAGNAGIPGLVTSTAGAGSTETVTQFSSASPTDTSVNDGFTLSLTVNSDDSWTVTSTGLSDDFNESGASLPGSVTYADVASSLFVTTTLQSNGEPLVITQVNYGGVTLETIPEPSAIALLAGAVAITTLRRRR